MAIAFVSLVMPLCLFTGPTPATCSRPLASEPLASEEDESSHESLGFHDAFDEEERNHAYDLLMAFDALAQQHNISYSLFYGSLFGAHCQQDQVSYDDDLDLMVFDWQKLLDLQMQGSLRVSQISGASYRLTTDHLWHKNMKFWNEGMPKTRRGWSAPFLDIAGIVCNDTCDDLNTKSARYELDDMFPLKRAPFGDLMLPIPQRPAAILEAKYKVRPCEVCYPNEWCHLMEMPRVKDTNWPRAGGVSCEHVMRRLSDSFCASHPVTELPLISLRQRAVFFTKGYYAEKQKGGHKGFAMREVINKELCYELSSVEEHNDRSRHVAVHGRTMGTINVAFLKMHRSGCWRKAADRLERSQIIVLSEVDDGMARTDNEDVAQQMALASGKNYVKGIEFVELPKGLPDEALADSDEKGFQCNAILSNFPLGESQVIRFKETNSERIGSRMALLTKAELGSTGLWILVTHIEFASQLEVLKKALSHDSIAGPLLIILNIVGDMRWSQSQITSWSSSTGLRFEAIAKSAHEPAVGHELDEGVVRADGSDNMYMGTRGLNAKELSDSAFVELEVSLMVGD